jgi:hypothetical protein
LELKSVIITGPGEDKRITSHFRTIALMSHRWAGANLDQAHWHRSSGAKVPSLFYLLHQNFVFSSGTNARALRDVSSPRHWRNQDVQGNAQLWNRRGGGSGSFYHSGFGLFPIH